MKKIFWNNPYQQTLTTKIVSICDNRFLFEETIAFSFSGGQESDIAFVNGIPVTDSKIEGNLIFYTLKDGNKFRIGDEVVMEIDWSRRHKLMRLHFAAELILELVTKKLGIEKIGAHIAETKARIDFVYDKNISSVFDSVMLEYNQIIESDKLIKTGFSDFENQRRFWEIEGFSKVPCGGTHVKSTSEVGLVTLKRKNIGNLKERIEIQLLEAGI